MTTPSHRHTAAFIWKICNLLRGPYKRNEYRKVILPLTVLRRFDAILAPTKTAALARHAQVEGKPEAVVHASMVQATGRSFYNTSPFDFATLLGDPAGLAPNLVAYINGFSPNVREILHRFGFEVHIARMAEKNILFEVVKAFATLDLSERALDGLAMGYLFEELIRIGAEQSNEEAGEHFTPREVIRLMVNILLAPEGALEDASHRVQTIYDPACGTGGMLSVASEYLRDHDATAQPMLFGQDLNDEAWATCRADMLIKGEDAERIARGDSFTEDAFARKQDGTPWTFDYMLANPPFGVEWKQQQKAIEREHDTLGFDGRFGAGTPRINDGSLLFLQHMLSKMRAPENGGSRIGVVFNGSPLFSGDAGSGESEIRRWILENDWLEAVVALPDQLFYNTGISTYLWILTNAKADARRGTVQLLDARRFYVKMAKSLGNKRHRIPGDEPGDALDHLADITRLYGMADHPDGQADLAWTFGTGDGARTATVSKVFPNEAFGYHKITVERPLQRNFEASPERIARLDDETAFQNLATSTKKAEAARAEDIAAGKKRQQTLRDFLDAFARAFPVRFMDREVFRAALLKVQAREGVRLAAAELKAVESALSEHDLAAAVCRDRKGRPEPDPALRDTETVPLGEDVAAYLDREVLPHAPGAWVDDAKTKVGYEIPFNRHFYVYEPPRPLGTIRAELRTLEADIARMLAEVTA